MSKAIFYHAGCPVCMTAELMLLKIINISTCPLEIVHLKAQDPRLAEAEAAGVRSVPALVVDQQVFHINFGANLAELKA